MSLPCRLYPGYVSIYGARGTTGISAETKGFQFGVVNQLYDANPNTLAVDQSVMFRVDDSIIVEYSGARFFILPENKVILIETILS